MAEATAVLIVVEVVVVVFVEELVVAL